MKREDLILKIKELYDVEPENTFKSKNVITFRHNNVKNKMFGVLMKIEKIKVGIDSKDKFWILNVKVNKEKDFGLRNSIGIVPAFHMNKEHWIGIDIELCPNEMIFDLIDDSYNETQ